MDKKGIGPKKWTALGVPVIFAAGAALHFAYPLSGSSGAVAPFAPVNESVWEHTKMAYLPTLAWWGGYYAAHRDTLPADRWFTAAAAALIACIAAMPMGYYLYTGIIGRHFLAADISLLAIAAAISQALGWHVYKHSRRGSALAAAAAIAAVGGVFWLFTRRPPRLPLFRDPLTGAYGRGR